MTSQGWTVSPEVSPQCYLVLNGYNLGGRFNIIVTALIYALPFPTVTTANTWIINYTSSLLHTQYTQTSQNLEENGSDMLRNNEILMVENNANRIYT